MRVDVVFAGVGGQGVITVTRLLAAAALESGLNVVQGELHGMSQRGGAVQAQLRVSDEPIESPQVARGAVDLLIGLEPVEALRHLPWLAPGGRLCSATRPVENVPHYPPLEDVLSSLRAVPEAILIDARALALEAGSARSENFVLAGAAAALLPIAPESVLSVVEQATELWSEHDRSSARAALAAGRAAADAGVLEAFSWS